MIISRTPTTCHKQPLIRYSRPPATTIKRWRGITSPPAGGWRLPVIASFGVGVGIGVDFCRSVFARFLANSIPSLAESSFSWPNAIPISFSTPIPIPTPTPILSVFLCLSLSANLRLPNRQALSSSAAIQPSPLPQKTFVASSCRKLLSTTVYDKSLRQRPPQSGMNAATCHHAPAQTTCHMPTVHNVAFERSENTHHFVVRQIIPPAGSAVSRLPRLTTAT